MHRRDLIALLDGDRQCVMMNTRPLAVSEPRISDGPSPPVTLLTAWLWSEDSNLRIVKSKSAASQLAAPSGCGARAAAGPRTRKCSLLVHAEGAQLC
jgi:hypothetical protein